ncbi:MAG: hypothetical protein FWF88_04680, partial [Peptococcaceae bacterium]|nr:hypothetical protein [Peptococcaceae bacterium]
VAAAGLRPWSGKKRRLPYLRFSRKGLRPRAATKNGSALCPTAPSCSSRWGLIGNAGSFVIPLRR